MFRYLRWMPLAATGSPKPYSHTPGGRIATSTQTAGGASYPFSYEYYLDGSQKSVTYPSGRKISYPDPDLAGRVTKVEGLLAGAPKSYVSSIGYNEHGLLASMALGTANNLIEKWSYSAKRLQPYDIRLGTAAVEDGAGRWEYSYCSGGLPGSECAGNNGNVMHQRIKPLNAIQNYAYDPMNRLSLMEETAGFSAPSCAGAGSTPCRAFGYDDWSNMYVSYSRVVTTNSFTPVSTAWFDSGNRLANVSLGIAHDVAGNQTAIGGYASTFDAENRLATSTLNSVTTSYGYDGEGRRVTKSTGGVTTTFVYDAAGRLAAEYGGAPSPTGGTSFLTADHLGSTRLVVKSDGTPDRRIDYLPFGEFIPAGVGGRTTGLGYESSEVLAAVNRRFTGKERDGETGLDFFVSRNFSAAQGRFTSPDAMIAKKEWLADTQRWNHYAYVRNNPLRYIDPNGEDLVIYYYFGSDLTDEQRKYFQNNMKQIQAAITAKFNKAGVENVVFREGKLTDAQVKELQKNAPTGVATLNFVNEKFAGKSIGGNGGTDAPISVVSLNGVAEGGLVASRAKDDATMTFRIGEVASHELGHAIGFESNQYLNWPFTLGIADYFRSNLMDEHQGQPTREKSFDTGSDRNKRIIEEINRIGENTPRSR